MKKIFTAILCFLITYIILGCHRTPMVDNITPALPTRPEEVKDLPYDPFELFKYVSNNIKEQDSSKKNLYLLTLEDSLIQNLSVIGNIVTQVDVETYLNNNTDNELLFNKDVKELDNSDIKQELMKITSSGYLLQKSGTQYIPAIDYEVLLSLDEDITPSLRSYFEMKSKDVYEPVLIAGRMTAKPIDILNRLISIENFIKKYPKFERNFDLIARYQSWLYLLFTGTTSTPTIDEYGNLKPVFTEMLGEIQEDEHISCEGVKRGFSILEKNNYNYDDSTSEQLRAIVRDKTEQLKEITEME